MLVCLGNPGDQYENTRHNVGFMVADQLGERYRLPIQKLKFKALTNIFSISGEKVLVMKPVTYMNLSGEAVRPAADFYKIPPEHIIVISDDTALDVGKLRIRKGGSAGGHNGLKSIISTWAPTSSPAFGWAWAKSPIPTMTWPTGCWASSRGRTARPSPLPWSAVPTRWSAISKRGPTAP